MYSSIENPKMKTLKKLQEKKYRDQTGLFLVEGEHLVEEAKKHHCLKEVYFLEDQNKEPMVTEKVMKYLSNLSTPPKQIGVCQKGKIKKEMQRVVLLDDIQDPGNLGTIIRSMVAFHTDTLILSPHCADVYSTKVLRATQGMIFQIQIFVCDLNEAIQKLKEKNIPVYGTKINHGKNIKTVEKISKFAIIMGNEGNGVHPEILNQCDAYFSIAMSEQCESLNVGVATSILLYELDK